MIKPTIESILFDLDSTIFSMASTLVTRVSQKYKDLLILEAAPLIKHMLPRNGLMAMHFTTNVGIETRLFAD